MEKRERVLVWCAFVAAFVAVAFVAASMQGCGLVAGACQDVSAAAKAVAKAAAE